MNLTFGFEDRTPVEEMGPPVARADSGAASSLSLNGPINAIAARFEGAMLQDESPVRAVRHRPAKPAQYAEFPG